MVISSVGNIELQNITLSYKNGTGTRTIIEDLSLRFPSGSFTSLIGTSGCGKSTLLNAIGGHCKPTSGHIILDGVDIKGPNAELGIVFQQHTLFPWKTVKENVRFGPMQRGIGKSESNKLADGFISLVGLSGFEDYYPKMLSGGMQHRVEIARSLANKPAVLLMDEPFGALDAQMRAMLQESLISIWKNTNVTIIFVTHDVEEALLLSQRVVIIPRHAGAIPTIIETNRDYSISREEYLFKEATKNLKSQCLSYLVA